METITAAIATIFLTKALEKSGEKFGEGIVAKVKQAIAKIHEHSPETAKMLTAGEDIDIQQAVIDVEVIADDPEAMQVLEELRSLLANNQALTAKVEALIAQNPVKTVQVMASGIEATNLKAKSMQQKAPANSDSVEQTMLKNVTVTGDIDLGDLSQEA